MAGAMVGNPEVSFYTIVSFITYDLPRIDGTQTGIANNCVSKHSKRGLIAIATSRKFRQVRLEGTREVERDIEYYNLDVIISVGYRVKSQQGTQFRIWATQRLKEYLLQGFSLNEEKLKSGKPTEYFDKLQSKLREIRLSAL